MLYGGVKGLRIKSTDKRVFNIISIAFISCIALICVVPFLVVLSGSFTDEHSIIVNGFGIIPKVFSTHAYQVLFENFGQILKAYSVTIIVTLVGTLLGLFLISMTAFVLSLRSFEWANRFSFFFYFTTLFSGGLVPWYILCVQYLHFKQLPFVAMIVPYLFNVFYLLVMKSFMRSVPDAVIESATIDGAGYFRIFIRIILPITKPALATIGLFLALNYWNDWYLAFLYVNNSANYPLQFYLYRMINMANALRQLASASITTGGTFPQESIKMAMTIIAIGPIVFLYPFVQKYFVKGLTIGAVKG